MCAFVHRFRASLLRKFPFSLAVLIMASDGRRDSGSGRWKWSPGQKLWDQHLHLYKVVGRGLGKVNSAPIYELGFRQSTKFDMRADLADVRRFAEASLKADASELLNRPAVGLSIAVQSLARWQELVSAAVEEKIFHPDLKDHLDQTFAKYDFPFIDRMLNFDDWKEKTRADGDVHRACRNLLRLSIELSSKWGFLYELMGFSASMTCGVHWAMNLAAMTVPGHYAQHLDHIPATLKAARKKLEKNPNSSSALAEFLTAVVIDRRDNGYEENKKRVKSPVKKNQKAAQMTPTPKTKSRRKPATDSPSDSATPVQAKGGRQAGGLEMTPSSPGLEEEEEEAQPVVAPQKRKADKKRKADGEAAEKRARKTSKDSDLSDKKDKKAKKEKKSKKDAEDADEEIPEVEVEAEEEAPKEKSRPPVNRRLEFPSDDDEAAAAEEPEATEVPKKKKKKVKAGSETSPASGTKPGAVKVRRQVRG